MNLLPKKNTWRKTILFYRFLRYRKGFGVHSPFAFALITRVINERWGFYCYDDIELIRRQLVHKGSTGVRREIKRSHGQLLFRVVNYFKPKRILQIGSPAGIATLYLTSYASDIQCIALEADAESARETAWCMRKYAHAPAEVLTGDYKETLPQALQKLGTLDFAFFHAASRKGENRAWVEEALKHIHPDSVFFFEGIRANAEMRQLWKELCLRPEVILSFDLYNIGLLFFNPRLHKQNYIVYF